MSPQQPNLYDTPSQAEQVNGLPSPGAYPGNTPPAINNVVQVQQPPGGAMTPTSADDNDLIEREWVDAAKRIFDDNKQDPYAQSRAMTILRADYMKKRYGKDIKTAGDR